MSNPIFNNIFDRFGNRVDKNVDCNCVGKHKHPCKKNNCGEEPCGCDIKLTTDCVIYTGKETKILKKNKPLTQILADLEKESSKKYTFTTGVKQIDTPEGIIVTVDEGWLMNFITSNFGASPTLPGGGNQVENN